MHQSQLHLILIIAFFFGHYLSKRCRALILKIDGRKKYSKAKFAINRLLQLQVYLTYDFYASWLGALCAWDTQNAPVSIEDSISGMLHTSSKPCPLK